MDFSIIVPAYNRAEEIGRCVASLYKLDYAPTAFEVLVVDNGSTDETARTAAERGARVLHIPEANRCLARNAGAAVARGRWLAFTDSDCEADPGWLRELAAAEKIIAEEPGGEKVGLIAGAIASGEPRSVVEEYIHCRRWLDQEKFLESGRKYSPPFAATANLAIRADVFKFVGGFDPEMPAAEDADLCWRAARAGWGIRYAPRAMVIHHHRATAAEMTRQARGYGIGNAMFFAKHRADFGAESWVEFKWIAWAIKGLLKSPFGFAAGRDELARRIAWYDFRTNWAQAMGRIEGGRKRGVRVI